MNETLNEATVKKQLTKKDLIRCFLIWETTSESCLSYERLMSMGFCHAMTPIINRLYADNKEERIKALRRHMMFFNTENNWGAFIPGLVASMEEDMANGGNIDEGMIKNIKVGLMGPLAGIGDTITQGLVKTVALAIGVDMTLKGSALGPIIFCLLYGIYLMAMGIFTFSKGYTLGRSILSKITDKRIMNKITDILSIIGLTIAGAMIANNVNITTPLQFTISDSTIVIQDLLNSILPGLLSVVAVVGVFMSLRKNTSVFKIMIIMFVIAVVCSLIGIL
ncbi:PTS system mannose/fructose/sorbose family transporter subunit IID [Faecalicoccus pleomorphus]|uniref:PTS system mannose/fructose/sorbose family transporter subunit IID n=1 Tax=Faecalicoccus pleomorphus TaxID=1323 RepID=A0AAW6CNH6_9FIRM|nr:PTS system mannose/fructose/sorbose family transporter subunit IID [Faecalicoccus pleomorphus]MDB7979657.1 PTS system mannose/fructose/sorbose family transporter subunit IID [Faecalicoccus pleomorphus]MDB7981948.1 PTS system mannose/fructose/sorbose family transporter subunit IID [Faecalicoccus pleomorphus]